MKQFWKLSSILAVLALLVVMGISTSDVVRAQASITVDQGYLCSGGDGCTLWDNDTDATNDVLYNASLTSGNLDTADNVLSITYEGASAPTAIAVTVGGTTKTYGVDTHLPARLHSTIVDAVASPLRIAVIATTVPAPDDLTTLAPGSPQQGDYAIQAFSGNSITIDFYAADKAPFQAAKTVTVDNFAPSIIVDSPENPFVTKTSGAASVTFSATITDSLASFGSSTSTAPSVQASTRLQYDTNNRPDADDNPTPAQLRQAETDGGRIDLYIGSVEAASPNDNGARAPLKASHLEKVDNGWRVTWTVGAAGLKPFITDGAKSGKVPWHIEAVDRAGNIVKSSGGVKGTTDANGETDFLGVPTTNFGDGEYAESVFVGRKIKITPPRTVDQDVYIAAPAEGGTVTDANCEELDSGDITGSPTIEYGDAKWSVPSLPKADQTRTVATFTAAELFTWISAEGVVQVSPTLTGQIDHDGVETTSTVDCTITLADQPLPKGTTIEVLNTRSVILDDEAPEVIANGKHTGYAWNGAKDKGDRLQSAPSAKRNSIMLEIKDTSGLDESTVTPSAFAVAGNTVSSVLVVDTANEDADDKRVGNTTGNILVFLTLGSNLETSATPNVSIGLGVVKDNAGNALNSAATPSKAADGIGPTLTLSTDKPLSNKSITITVESDEDLGAPPDLWNELVVETEEDGEKTGIFRAERDKDNPRTTSPSGSLQRFTYKHTATSGTVGEYNVYVEGEDTVGEGNAGNVGHMNDPAHSSAFTYELDTQLNGGQQPKVTIGEKEVVNSQKGGDNEVVAADVKPFEAVDPMIVTIDFAQEGKEYDRDSYPTVQLMSASLTVKADDGTTLEKRDFDPTTEISTQDNIKFVIALLTPRNGNYSLTVTAMDEAGNNDRNNPSAPAAENLAFSWKVVAPKPVNIDMFPGWNLISLPFPPANPAINSVIPADHPVEIIMTRDNLNQVWLVSRRDAETGLFTGDIAVLTANTAYFMLTSTFEKLKLLRPPLATAAAAPPPPPAIDVVKGWNLVPVVSNKIPTPPSIAADEYFGTLKSGAQPGWLKALSFDTQLRTWESVSPNEKDADGNPVHVTVGKGYWLYATVDGVIIP